MIAGFFSILKKLDWVLIAAVLLLVVFGLVTIYSIGINSEVPSTADFTKQAIAAGIGLILMTVLAMVSFRFWQSYAVVLYIVGFLLLLVVLIFGTEVGGTRGWLAIGSYTFQPVEFVKLFLIVFLAHFFSSRELELTKFKNILISGGAVVLFILLVVLQPDLGSAIMMLLIWLGLLFLSRVKRSHLTIIVVVILIVSIIGWFFFLADYQKDRLSTFVRPDQDPLGQGYNITQSIIAAGSGMWFGRGLGLGPQSQLNFLPTQETDFIFSVIAEELGLVGAGLVIILFAVLFWRILKSIKKARDSFSVIFISGALILLFCQMMINIGMNLGVLPVTGLPLPFVSLGGTSLIASLIIIGIIQSIVVRGSRS